MSLIVNGFDKKATFFKLEGSTYVAQEHAQVVKVNGILLWEL